jgi:hypothetical protein
VVDPRNARKYGWLAAGVALYSLPIYSILRETCRPDPYAPQSIRAAVGEIAARIGPAPAAADSFPLSVPGDEALVVQGPATSFSTVRLLRRKLLRFPGAGGSGSSHAGDSDSNSPAHWDGDTFYLLSSAVRSWRISGPDLFHINAAPNPVTFDREINGGRWIESTWKSEDGILYGWYHNEPSRGASEPSGPEAKLPLTAPRIGAARSRDNGATWEDLGIILAAPAGSLRRDSHNSYFAGGNGDFSVIPDQERGYLYFLFSTYTGDLAEQGVSIARLRYADRDHPAGRVRKWRAGRWSEPGLGGRVTPVFAAAGDWHGDHPDAFWGPSIHWNSYLRQYVVLLNRAIDPDWTQEGIYIALCSELADPARWTLPQKLLDRQQIVSDPVTPNGWYPQVIGLDRERRETDKLAGRTARLFIHGRSRWEIQFSRPDEAADPVPGDPRAPPLATTPPAL